MKKRIFAVAAALCLLAGTGAFAQDSKKAPMMKERPTAEQMAQRRTERMTEKLNLSEKQSKQLYEVNLQDIKEMQAQAEQMRAYRKAQAEKMKGILTPEQFEQWKQMQGPRHGMNRGPRMKDGRGDKAASAPPAWGTGNATDRAPERRKSEVRNIDRFVAVGASVVG